MPEFLFPNLKENPDCKCGCHDMKDYSKPKPYPTPLREWFSHGCGSCSDIHK